MKYRYIALVVALACAVAALVGCSSDAATADTEQPQSTPVDNIIDVELSPSPLPTAAQEELTALDVSSQGGAPDSVEDAQTNSHVAKPNVGLIIPDDGSLLMRCAMHGFLRTAENLNYPARLYAMDGTKSADEVVKGAIEDGCGGLLVWADTAELKAAAKYASEQGVTVVVPYAHAETDETGAVSVLSPDPDDYATEAVRVMCTTTIGRGNKQGTIVIAREAGAHQDLVDAIQRALDANYPQFTLTDMPLAATPEESQAAAQKFVEEHAEISGVFALSPTTGNVWNDGEVAAEKALKVKRTPVIMTLDYTSENIKLVQNSKVLCIIARPFYASAAQAMMVLDSALSGAPVQAKIRVNAPIIQKKHIERYDSIVDEVVEWFGMQ